MKGKYSTGFLIMAMMLMSLSIKGQYPSDSLYEYIRMAIRNNPGLMQNYYGYTAALQKIPQAGALQDPQLSTGILLSPMELPMGRQLAEIQLMQMFPWFGTLRAARDEMSLMANAKYEAFEDSKQQLIYDMRKTWNDLYRTNKQIELYERNVDILKTIERLSLIRFKTGTTSVGSGTSGNSSMQDQRNNSGSKVTSQGMSGMVGAGRQGDTDLSASSNLPAGSMEGSSGTFGLADIYRIQIETGELQNNLALLKTQYQVILARFNSFLNRPSQTMVPIPDTLTADPLQFDISIYRDSMLINNKMLTMLQYEKKSLEARTRMVSRMGYPMVGLGLNYTIMGKLEMSDSEMNGRDMIMPMFTVSLPVYRKKYRSMRNESEQMIASTEQSMANTSNALEIEYFQAVESYEDAVRRLSLFREQRLLAGKSLDILLKSFSTSGISLTDILTVRRQLLDYDYRIIEALADLNTAVAWLERLGNINQ